MRVSLRVSARRLADLGDYALFETKLPCSCAPPGSILLLHLAVSHVMFHSTASRKTVSFLGSCFLGLMCPPRLRLSFAPRIYDSLWLRTRSSTKNGRCPGGTFPSGTRKKQIISVPFSLPPLPRTQLLGRFLKMGVQVLIAQGDDSSRNPESSGRRATRTDVTQPVSCCHPSEGKDRVP